MSEPQFIITVRNMSKCEPDNYFVCGAKAPISPITACVKQDEVLLDEQQDAATVFRGLENTTRAYSLLQDLGFEGIQVYQKTVSYQKTQTEVFDEMAKQAKIIDILDGIDPADIKYLEENGILQLTNVT